MSKIGKSIVAYSVKNSVVTILGSVFTRSKITSIDVVTDFKNEMTQKDKDVIFAETEHYNDVDPSSVEGSYLLTLPMRKRRGFFGASR